MNRSASGRVAGGLRPPALLLISGSLIGFNFPLGKLAAEAGLSPLVWAGLVSLGVVLCLLPLQILRGALRPPSAELMRYTLLSALISFVAPNLLLYSVIPELGAGYAGLMFALSPVFTLAFAALLGMQTTGRLGLAGIGLGLLGAVIVSLSRGTQPQAPAAIWFLAAAAVPVALAAGNVYRSRYWPAGAAPDQLAFWGHASAGAIFLGLILASHGPPAWQEIRPAGGIILLQMLVAGLNFPVFYRLQRDGGPVLLSQIGYVAAAVGLIAATAFLGERYSAATWLGAGIIATGILASIRAQPRA